MFRLATIAILFFTIPVVAFGSSVVRSGDTVSIAADQAVEGDFYGLANTTVVSGEVTGDLLIAAMKLTVNGKVNSDLAATAGAVDIHGVVGDDARIIAGEVTVAGEVNGDLVVVASSLKVLSTAKINGDIIFFGSEAEISGLVKNNILGTSENIRVDGVVGGDIDIKTNVLTLGEKTDVAGMVKYTSITELVRAQNARVAGKVVKNDPVFAEVNGLRDFLIPVLILLFAVLVWFLMFRRTLERVVTQVSKHSLRSMLTGFGIFFLMPIAATILIASTLGILLGIILFFVYLVLILISLTISGVVVGAYLAKLLSKPKVITVSFILIGTLITIILMYIPVVGPILLTGLFFITLGALTVSLYRLVRFS